MSYYTIRKVLEHTNYGNKFTVERVLVETPDGRQAEFYMRSGQDFAVIVPILEDNKTLIMVEQPRLGIEGMSLEFPMGQVEGKHDEDIASIELKQETGYTADQFICLGTLQPSPGWSTQRALVYVATGLTEGQPEPEPYEDITVRNVTIDELKEIIASGKLTNMPTIAALYLLEQYLAEKQR